MQNIITVSGIRPDFIRMSEIFKKLDADQGINHTLIHTGQHFDSLLSSVFFEELEIRSPDYNLEIGGSGREHFHQNAELTVKLIELIRNESLDPDTIIFLGDSNSVLVAPSLAKEGYRVAHIEAGMRSGDRRMLEEINRIMCDHSSDLLFTYHPDYSLNLFNENISQDKVFCVGNTITEVARKQFSELQRHRLPHGSRSILLDIHRPENFLYRNRLQNIFNLANRLSKEYDLRCLSLQFPRTYKSITEFDVSTGDVEAVPLMPYKKYIQHIYDCQFIISDSGTAQEEPALIQTPVLVPRDFSERPQSYEAMCSKKIDVNKNSKDISDVKYFIDTQSKEMNSDWLGEGTTASKVLRVIKEQSHANKR